VTVAEESGKADKAEKTATSDKSGEPDKKSPPDSKVVPDGDGPKRRGSKVDGRHIRVQLARVVGLVFLLLALVLALAALCIALDANADNSFVKFVLDLADSVDLGVFDLSNPIKEFGGENGPTKEALLNYGLGAVVYLIVGRILERIIRP
jgi:hypothetical protein